MTIVSTFAHLKRDHADTTALIKLKPSDFLGKKSIPYIFRTHIKRYRPPSIWEIPEAPLNTPATFPHHHY